MSAHQAGQFKCRGRLQLGTSVYADDLGADRTAIGHLAQSGRSEPRARVEVVCQRHPTRQGGCPCRINSSVEQWASRRPCESAQAHETEHVWPCQAPTAREHVCCMWPRKSLLAQLSWLDSDMPARARRGGARRSGRCGNRKSMRGAIDPGWEDIS